MDQNHIINKTQELISFRNRAIVQKIKGKCSHKDRGSVVVLRKEKRKGQIIQWWENPKAHK